MHETLELNQVQHILQIQGLYMSSNVSSKQTDQTIFPQVLQGYDFSPVWVLMWCVKEVRNLKSMPHVLQE